MRKITTLGVAALTIAVNILPMTTQAAGLNSCNQLNGGQQVVTIGQNCNLQDLQSQLQSAGINCDGANLNDILSGQNVQDIIGKQSANTNIQQVLGAQYSNQECDTQQVQDAVKKAKELLNQQNCNNQTPVEQAPVQEETQTPVKEEPSVTVETPTDSKKDESTTPDKGEETNTGKDTTQKSYQQQVVDLVNVERAKEGLAPLSVDETVAKAATVRANEIQTKFDHVRPNGSAFVTALKEQGATYRGAGENIAWGQKTPQEVVTGWMNSPGHRANIMNKDYVSIGVGNTQNSAGTQYWVQIFTY